MGSAEAVAARAAKLSGLLQLKSVCDVRRQGVAHRILGGIEPAVHITHDVRFANYVGHGGIHRIASAVRVKGCSQRAARPDGKWKSAGVRVHARRSPVTQDIRSQTMREQLMAAAGG